MSAGFKRVKRLFAARQEIPAHVTAGPADDWAGGEHVSADDLPAELSSRVMAATAHASHRSIRRGEDRFCVWALCGDRIVSMALALRDDGSVAEDTDSFPAVAVTAVSVAGDDSTLDVLAPSGARLMRVPAAFAEAVRASSAGHR